MTLHHFFFGQTTLADVPWIIGIAFAAFFVIITIYNRGFGR